jgi:hypothetical protein
MRPVVVVFAWCSAPLDRHRQRDDRVDAVLADTAGLPSMPGDLGDQELMSAAILIGRSSRSDGGTEALTLYWAYRTLSYQILLNRAKRNGRETWLIQQTFFH